MKKYLFVILILLLSNLFFSQVIYYRDTATLQWDDVTTDINGNPLLPEDVLSYEIYIYDSQLQGIINDQVISNLIYIGDTTSDELEIVFPSRKNWIAGVRSKVIDGSGVICYSIISYSYDAGVVYDVPFLYAPLGSLFPKSPRCLKDSEIWLL